MRFDDLGFVFLLLPLAAALYACLPKRGKAVGLAALSALFLLWMRPLGTALLLGTLLLDCIALTLFTRKRLGPDLEWLLFCGCLAKDIFALVCAVVALPMRGAAVAPVGWAVALLCSLELLVRWQRNELQQLSPAQYFACTLFFGRLAFGPVGGSEAFLAQLSPAAVQRGLLLPARGVMLLTTGIAKRVILSDQLFALFRTIAQLPAGQYSVLLGWLGGLCAALGLHFLLSSYSDIAQGIAGMFSLRLPPICCYPMQAPCLREALYQLNAPLEQLLRDLLPLETRDLPREQPCARNLLLSVLYVFALGLLLMPSLSFLRWSVYFSLWLLLDWLLLRRIPAPFALPARLATLFVVLPGHLLLAPAPLGLLRAMFGLGGAPLINDTLLYLISSNLVTLLLGVLLCTGLVATLGRTTEQQFPRLWWVCATLLHGGLLLVVASFLLMNVR